MVIFVKAIDGTLIRLDAVTALCRTPEGGVVNVGGPPLIIDDRTWEVVNDFILSCHEVMDVKDYQRAPEADPAKVTFAEESIEEYFGESPREEFDKVWKHVLRDVERLQKRRCQK